MMKISAPPNGTTWTNIVPDSENLEFTGTGVGQWNHLDDSISLSGAVYINSVKLTGIISNSTNSMLRTAGAPGQISGDSVLIAGYFKAAKRAWAHLSISATDSSFASHGGEQYFNLSTGELGTFAGIGTVEGTLISAGMGAAGDGYWCWALVNCNGDASNGWTFATRPVIGDNAHTTADDSPDVTIYAGGLIIVDGPSGNIGYIST